ncbi:MAG: SpoIIE family protein phosphatase [Planctomycetia bacterium]|jgi:sigma-B regulation protein RsbU (phosphoserine phosphatase)
MPIRRKLTVLLLIVALVPLIIGRLVTEAISYRNSQRTADEMREVLENDAKRSLLTITQDFSRFLDAKERTIEVIARLQAQKIEKRIADAMLAKDGHKVINRPIKTTSSSEGLLLSEDKDLKALSEEEQANPELLMDDAPENVQSPSSQDLEHPVREELVPGSRDIFVVSDFGLDEKIIGAKVPIPDHYLRTDPRTGKKKIAFDVQFCKQRCYTIEEGEGDRRFELNALGSMTHSYWLLRKLADRDILWQYTILESGVITGYPYQVGHIGAGRVNDLRKASFYRRMKEKRKILEYDPVVDPSTGLTVITVGMPLFYPDGRFAGMTALDVIADRLFKGFHLPADWEKDATAMLVKRLDPHSVRPDEVVVLAKKTPPGITSKDIKEIEDDPVKVTDVLGRPIWLPSLKMSDQKLFKKVVKEAEEGHSDVFQMEFNGKESLCAFGPAREGKKANEPFLLVIVPKEKVIAQAEHSKARIIDMAHKERWITGIIFLAVALFAAVIGFRSARSVTQPIDQIAEAGIQLSEGNYNAHVNISTGDEFQRLGEIFNETGPKLLEREKMKHSLEMAMEVQQQLLPQGPPVCEGLDIAGESRYCDETGGDYYDYLLLQSKNENSTRLGVAIGDVSGHGIGAALMMAAVRSVLRSHASRYQDRLEVLMGILNQSLMDTGETGRFVTLCFSLFDPKERMLRWVSAGHDPAFHMHRNPNTRQITISELPNSGLPLGVLADTNYTPMGPVELNPGDVVLFGTDGIWETTDPAGNPFGKARLHQVMLDLQSHPADVIREEVLEAVAAFRGDAPQLDDITLVVVKVV